MNRHLDRQLVDELSFEKVVGTLNIASTLSSWFAEVRKDLMYSNETLNYFAHIQFYPNSFEILYFHGQGELHVLQHDMVKDRPA